MNKLASKKSILKNCQSYGSTTDKKQKKKEKCKCSNITKKIKNNRRATAKVKKVIQNTNFFNEWAENESSRPELYEKPAVITNLKNVTSEDSIIYIGSYKKNQDNTSYIDLTHNSSDNLHSKINLVHSKSLKTIYLSRNFDKGIKLRKSMATTSLITLPVIKKERLPKKLNSTTVLNNANKEKLALLDIPEEYLDMPDLIGDYSFFERVKLTANDHNIIDWILDVEADPDFSLSSSTSGYNSSLDTDTSIEKMCNLYSVNSKDKINHI